MDQVIPFLLLAGGLLAFLASTRQFPLIWRALVWLVGAGLIAGATFCVASMQEHYGLFRVVQDAWTHIGSLENSVLVQAFQHNAPSVGRFVVPLLDLFLVIGVVLGILALVAFTPGEGLEKLHRPLAVGLLGAMLGGAVALVAVGIGFGAPVGQRVFADLLDGSSVHDGDTLWIGQVSVRLRGLEAPELSQTCRNGVGEQCGRRSREHLQTLVRGNLVYCDPPDQSDPERPLTESFGRPLMDCFATTPDGKINLAQRMILDGYAVQYRSREGRDFGFGDEEEAAKEAGRGLHSSCTLEPRVWRNNRAAREAFKRGELPDVETIGCGAQLR